MDELKIEYVPIDSIQEYDGNAKQHSDRQIEQIAQSIREFGFNDPIAVEQLARAKRTYEGIKAEREKRADDWVKRHKKRS